MARAITTAAAFALAAIATLANASTASVATLVDASVHRALRQQGSVNIMVTMKQGTREALDNAQESMTTTASRGEKITQLVESLEAHATESQQDVLRMLSQEATSEEPLYKSKKSFWITNQIFFEEASSELVDRLSRLDNVAKISPELVVPLPKLRTYASPGSNTTKCNTQLQGVTEWGVRMIKAPEVWAKGFDGKGIVVGNIDSGVLATHEALKNNFRGEYGWFDVKNKSAVPSDDYGHGSHTMGTIAGSNGIGVAPGATWMACKACDYYCSESDFLACFEFMTCPTDPQGKNKDCSKAPHVVNNSWGFGQGEENFAKAIQAWHQAGIIPVFSIGNDGPGCGTAHSPGDLPSVISVGATTASDGLAFFSSKGPSVKGLMKPELSAPGNDVCSVSNENNNYYRVESGTSMAAPHVTGAVALILQAKPNTKFDQLRDLLMNSVDTQSLSKTPMNGTCGGKGNSEFPNNAYGAGRLNVLKAVSAGGWVPQGLF